MRTCYVLPLPDSFKGAIADLAPGEISTFWTITRINVPVEFRGQGYGKALLDMILADADSTGRTLWLQPASSGGLEQATLEAWYERNGFRWYGFGMRRHPNNL